MENNKNQNKEIEDKWYYIIVQNPGTSTEQFVGFSDSKTNCKFIPAFKSKDDAETCFALMPKDIFNGQYDAQAVIQEDLSSLAKENGHEVYLLDEKGTILNYVG
ncbi:MAG: hypothetical protein GY729_16675 [Desulfobacteraceae bacterium]|nr:hypothetical protein [Desulfobacteraceae bacterium]